MKTITLLVSFLLTPAFLACAQNGTMQTGARAMGLGYATATVSDGWSMFNNVSGLAVLKNKSAHFAIENKFGVEGLNVMGAAFIMPLKVGAVGLSIFRFGDKLYNEQAISLGYANRFGIAALGIKASYLQYNAEGFGSKGILNLDIGGIAEITPKLFFGAYITNLNQASVSDFKDERAPTVLRAGVSYRPLDKLMLNAEVEKDVDFEANTRIGLEYEIIKKVRARTGISTRSFSTYFGLGFKHKALEIDYAFTNTENLGFSHQASVSYFFNSTQ